MKFTQKMVAFAALIVMIISSGCSVSRDQMAKEYDRLAALPPVPVNHCPYDQALNSLGIAVSQHYNFAHKLMKEFVGATENRREYLGFMNEIEYLVKEEKMEEPAAMAKVVKEIQENDAKIKDPKEKVWPRVVEGIVATNALAPEKKLAEAAPVAAATTRAIADCRKLKDSFRGLDATTAAKAVCAAKIIKQGTDASECLAFLTIQFQRTIKAKYYVK